MFGIKILTTVHTHTHTHNIQTQKLMIQKIKENRFEKTHALRPIQPTNRSTNPKCTVCASVHFSIRILYVCLKHAGQVLSSFHCSITGCCVIML